MIELDKSAGELDTTFYRWLLGESEKVSIFLTDATKVRVLAAVVAKLLIVRCQPSKFDQDEGGYSGYLPLALGDGLRTRYL